MGCVIRRKYRLRSGKLVRSKRYYLRYVDANGRERTERAFTDHRASDALLAERESEAARGIVHLKDPFEAHKGRPLTSHVADFIQHLLADGVSAAYVQDVDQRLKRAIKEIGASHVSEVTTSKVDGHLLRLVESGRSYTSRNHVRDELAHFFAWGIRDGRWATNPVAPIKRLNVKAAPRRLRRALDVDELHRLVEVARVRPREQYLKSHPEAPAEKLAELDHIGHQRSTLYLTAALTGLREAELQSLRWADLSLDAEAPTVTVRSETAKSKRKDTLPLVASVAVALRTWREAWAKANWRIPGAGDPVFTFSARTAVRHLRSDCKYARPKIETERTDGRLDFHALRHSTASLLCRAGVSVRTAQSLMRHTDPRTTMRVYAHIQGADRLDAVARLGALTAEPAKPKVVAAGG